MYNRSDCTANPDSNYTTCSLNTTERIQVYTSFSANVVLLVIVQSFLWSVLSLRASQVLHNRMFYHVLRAPVNFFHSNPVGRSIVPLIV